LKKFICTRGWKRNPTNDIIEEWEYNKLPDEVKNRNFKEYIPTPETKPTSKPEPKPVLEVPVVVAPPVVEPKLTNSRFKPFAVEDSKGE
tara:strand:+ start:29 stop:295 length:267 start_codon:yes stop_codon:yes gene_type:complete